MVLLLIYFLTYISAHSTLLPLVTLGPLKVVTHATMVFTQFEANLDIPNFKTYCQSLLAVVVKYGFIISEYT